MAEKNLNAYKNEQCFLMYTHPRLTIPLLVHRYTLKPPVHHSKDINLATEAQVHISTIMTSPLSALRKETRIDKRKGFNAQQNPSAEDINHKRFAEWNR
ncbi:hypothetical protein TNIN_355201 [Trichonephila inaurata madagascariensis]|uniref:Uncharacterized protein n=1 Tax=Trichonephila inaurata madagascariensis TaxID=2747483 RepID=A0A8X6XHP8_9ARAC|nr:hypothetical protein TNIN_355201 [Trichonephila inaurata madagascariensis]